MVLCFLLEYTAGSCLYFSLACRSALYASLCEDVIKIQRRSIKLFEIYAGRMKEERKYTVDDDVSTDCFPFISSFQILFLHRVCQLSVTTVS